MNFSWDSYVRGHRGRRENPALASLQTLMLSMQAGILCTSPKEHMWSEQPMELYLMLTMHVCQVLYMYELMVEFCYSFSVCWFEGGTAGDIPGLLLAPGLGTMCARD